MKKSQNSKSSRKPQSKGNRQSNKQQYEQQSAKNPPSKATKRKSNLRKVRKDSIWGWILDHLFNKSTKGAFDKQTSDFQISFNRIFSETHKKEVFHILAYPTYVYPGHLEEIRDKLRACVPLSMRDTFDLQIVQLYRNNEINVMDKKITRLQVAAQRSCRQISQDIAKVNDLIMSGQSSRISQENIMLAEKKLKKWERKAESYKVVQDHVGEGKTYNRTYVFLELACQTYEELTFASRKLQDILQAGIDGEPYIFEAVDIDLAEYMTQFGVASLQPDLNKKELFIPMNLPSKINAISELFKPGIVRDPYPEMYLGHAISNGYPYFTNIKATSDASNLLLLASSGSGKTTEVMTMLYWALANLNLHAIINDFKGIEYDGFINTFNSDAVGKISFSLDNPSVVNTYNIIDYRILGLDNAKQAYTLCSHLTADALAALVDAPENMRPAVDAICSAIVFEVYANKGVNIIDPDSYANSKDITFLKDTWAALNTLTYNDMKGADDQRRLVRKFREDDLNYVRSRLGDYFYERGSKTSFFAKEVSLDKIIGKRIIVINHGAQRACGPAKTVSELRFGHIQQNYISRLCTGINFKNHEQTLEVIEEVAQQLGDEYTCRQLCANITGCRSLGKTNILITNSLKPIVQPKRFEEYLDPVKSNLNRFLVGRCEKTEAQCFVDYVDRPEIAESLRQVVNPLSEEYQHSFMYFDKSSGMAKPIIVKAQLPQFVLDEVMATGGADYSGYLGE